MADLTDDRIREICEKIRPNDVTLHKPSGETWIVCGVNHRRDELVPCGYPFPTIAKATDCELVESRGLPQSDDMRRALSEHGMQYLVEDGEKGSGINIGKACAILQQIDSDKYTHGERAEAIRQVLDMPTHNGVTKDALLKVIRYLYDVCNEAPEILHSEHQAVIELRRERDAMKAELEMWYGPHTCSNCRHGQNLLNDGECQKCFMPEHTHWMPRMKGGAANG